MDFTTNKDELLAKNNRNKIKLSPKNGLKMKTKQNKIAISLILIAMVLITIKCKDNPVTPKPPAQPNSTSHEIVWEIDTLGAFNSHADAVWGSSPTNIWVTGWFTDGKGWGSNIYHYNGINWTAIDYFEAELNGVFGISENDIWAVGNNLTATQWYALVAHYDGIEWKTENVFTSVPKLISVWASGPNDVFAVGFEGTILHYDGNSWSQMESGTKYHLRDVWGFSPNDVYACGGDIDNAVYNDKPILLHYDGTSWESILDTTKEEHDYVISNWGTSSENLYFSSVTGFYQGSANYGWTSSVIPDEHTAKKKLRGSSEYNIFLTGSFGLILHYNGKTWHRYDEILSKSYPYGPYLVDIATFENFVFVVGDDHNINRAVAYKGTIKN